MTSSKGLCALRAFAGQEKFLRQSLMSFPHRHSTLWQLTVRQISPIKPGMAPTALAVLTQAINGQGLSMPMGDVSNEPCAACNEPPGFSTVIKLCCNCKEVGYCSVACQRLHWFTHKKYCPILKGKPFSVDCEPKIDQLLRAGSSPFRSGQKNARRDALWRFSAWSLGYRLFSMSD